MKVFQSQVMCMGEKKIKVECCRFYPSDAYPNGGDYCYHDFIEIEFFCCGKGIHYFNSVPYQVCTGMCNLLLPGDYHYYDLAEDEFCRLFNLKIDVSIPSAAIMEQVQVFPRPYAVVMEGEEYEQMERELDYLAAYCRDNPTPDLLSTNIVERVMILLLKNLKQNGRGTQIQFSEPLQSVIDHVNTHYRKEITNVQMAELTGVSAHYFSTYFKKHTGLAFCDYVNRVRLFRAVELLETTNLSMKVIAFMVGFSSQAYFTRTFTRLFGISPGKYRKGKVNGS